MGGWCLFILMYLHHRLLFLTGADDLQPRQTGLRRVEGLDCVMELWV